MQVNYRINTDASKSAEDVGIGRAFYISFLDYCSMMYNDLEIIIFTAEALVISNAVDLVARNNVASTDWLIPICRRYCPKSWGFGF